MEYIRPSFTTEGLKTYISSTTEIQRPLGWGYYSSALQSLNLKMHISALASEQTVPFFHFSKCFCYGTVLWLVSSCSFPPSYLFNQPFICQMKRKTPLSSKDNYICSDFLCANTDLNANTFSQRAGRESYPSKRNSGAVGIPTSHEPAFSFSRSA